MYGDQEDVRWFLTVFHQYLNVSGKTQQIILIKLHLSLWQNIFFFVCILCPVRIAWYITGFTP